MFCPISSLRGTEKGSMQRYQLFLNKKDIIATFVKKKQIILSLCVTLTCLCAIEEPVKGLFFGIHVDDDSRIGWIVADNGDVMADSRHLAF